MTQDTESLCAKKIIIQYEDGSVQELGKAAVFHFKPSPLGSEQISVEATLSEMTIQDLFLVVEAVLGLGGKLGLFRNIVGDSDDNEDD